ncbi:lipid-A-disaccharide synthase [Pyruvatibacter mobilis]|uniref:lipid-A-disaccharide synthase n=1 Tax=Pyruvatibacter mobilis TaxID=1712261 RepID=UPI003D114D66
MSDVTPGVAASPSPSLPQRAGTPLRVMLIAGEPSGDILGAELMASLRTASPLPIEFIGVGGDRMTAEGLNSIVAMSEIAVMGLREVVPRIPLIYRRIRQTARYARDMNPDVVVIIDSPDFTHSVAKRIARQAPHIPIINYVSPQVWAWRQGRAAKMATYLTHVLALLPFEPAFYAEKSTLACTFVGHPVLERVQLGGGDQFRARHNIAADTPVLALLPGSRPNEVKNLIGIFLDTARRLRRDLPDLVVVLPTVPNVAALVREKLAGETLPLILVEDQAEKFAAFDAANAALAASGTVSLELGLARVPTVIGYRIERLAAFIIRRLAKVNSIVLANLVLGRNVIPEYLQEDCEPETLARALLPLMTDTPERDEMLSALGEMRMRLGDDGGLRPAERAAEVVLSIGLPEKERRAAHLPA